MLRNAKIIQIADRRSEVARLLRTGISQAEIAERLGCSTATVSTDVRELLASAEQRTAADASRLREDAIARLQGLLDTMDAVTDKFADQVLAESASEKQGLVDESKIKAVTALNQSAATTIRATERLAKMLGLDAPAKSEVKVDLGPAAEELLAKIVDALVDEPSAQAKVMTVLDSVAVANPDS